MARKKATKVVAKNPAPAATALLFHRIHSLLETVRSIAGYEDELCTLLHAARNSDAVDADLNADLQSLLDGLQEQEYTEDLRLLREALPPLPGRRNSGPRGRNTITAKKASAAKKTSGAKKASAKKASAKKTAASRLASSKKASGSSARGLSKRKTETTAQRSSRGKRAAGGRIGRRGTKR
jgi:hypothetical protein